MQEKFIPDGAHNVEQYEWRPENCDQPGIQIFWQKNWTSCKRATEM